MNDTQRLTKNQLIKERGKATRERHSAMAAVTRELKLTGRSAAQEEALTRVFLEAKWLYNQLVTSEDWSSWDAKSRTASVRLPDGSFEERPLLHLGSQVRREVLKQLETSIKTLSTLKKKGKKVGALRPVRSVNSISFPQKEISYKLKGNKLKLQGLPGWFTVRGTAQLESLELANARLIRRPSGYYLKVTGFRAPQELGTLPGVGLDFGIKTHLTASDGREWSVTVRETERLKRLQRKLQRQVKGSRNRLKTIALLGREYERLNHRKDDLANKLVSELSAHSLVVLQDENLKQWKLRYGKTIQHSVLGRVKAKLSTLPQAVVLDRFAPTTQLCPSCGTLKKLALSQRVYSCDCGYSEQRDLHSARNMLLMAAKGGFERRTPAERRKAPVDREASAASSASRKPHRVEAGNETLEVGNQSKSGFAAPKRRPLQGQP